MDAAALFQSAIESGDLDTARALLVDDDVDQVVLSTCFKWVRRDEGEAIALALELSARILAQSGRIPLLLDLWNRLARRKKPVLTAGLARASSVFFDLARESPELGIQPLLSGGNTASAMAWLRDQSPRYAPLVEPFLAETVTAFGLGDQLCYCAGGVWRVESLTVLANIDLNMSRHLMFIIATPGQAFELLQRHMDLPRQRVYQWDRYLVLAPEVAAIALQLMDPKSLAGGEYRFHLIAPQHFARETAAFCRRGYTLADRIIGLPGVDRAPFEAWCAGRMQQQDQENKVRIAELQHYYHPGFEEALKQRFATGLSGARVLLFTSKFSSYVQYGTRDLASGFCQLGCKAMVHKEHRTQGLGFSMYHFYRLIHRLRPDVIVAINNFCSPAIRAAMPGLPFLTWMQDPPYTLTIPESLTDHDHVFAIGTRFIRDFPKVRPSLAGKTVHLLPVAFEPSIYKPIPDCEKVYDVSYVANLEMTPEIRSFYHPETRTGTVLERITHAAMDQLSSTPWPGLKPFFLDPVKARAFLNALLEDLGVALPKVELARLEEFLVAKLSHFFIRTGQLRAVIDAGFSVFIGGNGWPEVPFFAPYAHGRVNNGADLNRVYNQTRINLHASPEISFHHKVGEVLGAGGFLLTLEKPGYDILSYDGFFDTRTEMITYRDGADLVSKVRHYLAHPEEREAVAARARKTLFQRFKVQHAARNLLAPLLDQV